MKIYFAGAIRGGRENAALYVELVELLRGYGTVLTEHVADEQLTSLGELRDSNQQSAISSQPEKGNQTRRASETTDN